MKWFIPSWNGDIRVEPEGEGTLLTVFEPTAHETEVLEKIGEHALREGWADKWRKRWGKKVSLHLDAPFEKAGSIITQYMRPGAAVLTAISFKDGRVETVESVPAPVLEQKVGEAAAEGATAVATVKRPTPCCPNCLPGAIAPASEALLSFLTSEQHAMWAEHRAFAVTGGDSGHRYLLAHRHSPLGVRMGRICFDLDIRRIVHFHDWTVPPEEEVLAAKLILEHKEPWLRNEATLFEVAQSDRQIRQNQIFKNPFGDGSDGTIDATFFEHFGKCYAIINKIKLPLELEMRQLPGTL